MTDPSSAGSDDTALPAEAADPLFTLRPPVEPSAATVVVFTRSEGSEEEGPGRSGYRLLDELGRGGMGVVYRARQERVHRDVAVKTIRPDRADKTDLRCMFASEARITGFLDHPNIVPLHDLDVGDDGQLFMAMKLVGGRSWHELLRSGEPGLDRNLEILAAVTNAVAFAHSQGFIHRDLKPGNIMVGEFGEVLVMDWGLAVAFREIEGAPPGVPSTATARGIAGTLRYLAPEMAEGDGSRLGPWSDVFLLGAILYELVTGHAPNVGRDGEEILANIRAGRQPELGPEVPAELAAICRRAMSRDASERYPDASAFGEALRAHGSHRESRVLTARALADLESVSRGDAPAPSTDPAWQDAIAGFSQALRLWPGNPEAAAGLDRARLAFAAAARASGDLALAAAQLEGVDGVEAEDLRRAIDVDADRRARSARTNRRLRAALVGGLVLVLVGLAIGNVVLDRERDRADEAAEVARRNAARWRAALGDIQRLSDVQVLSRLLEERDALWPAGPETAAAIGAWSVRAEGLRERLPEHRRVLEELRAHALPPTEAQRRQAFADELTRLARLSEMAAAFDNAADEGGRRAEHLLEELDNLEGEIEDIDEELARERPWFFDDDVLQWNHDVLAALVRGITALHAPDGAADEIRRRLELAAGLRDATVTDHAEGWARTASRVAADDRFGGFALPAQIGLVPLGPDRKSGLEEFVHYPTHDGPLPSRDAKGRLEIDERTGLVLVLVPGGTLRIGPRQAPTQRDIEGPVQEVELAPFFIAKYEMNQAQWLRFSGANPSFYHPEFRLRGGRRSTLMHPVEQVTWTEATDVLRKLGLALPTEAQWEYAARAGSETAWFTGDDRDSLRGFVNIADATARRAGAPWPTVSDWPDHDDGFATHAPVTSLEPNPFGLHSVHGNVWEWCRDVHGVLHYPVRKGDGERLPSRGHTRAMRGGGFTDAVMNTRSGHRSYEVPDYQGNDLGVRPVRGLQ